MTSRTDLVSAIVTAFTHTAPGGVPLFQPDFVLETFKPQNGFHVSYCRIMRRGQRSAVQQ